MNTKTEVTIRYYIMYLGKMIGLLCWLIFLSSCEKEMGERGMGNKTPIIFSVSTDGHGASDEALRRAADGQKLRPITAPLGDDFYLSATLIPDLTEDLRVDELRALKDKQKICLAVYTSGSTPDETVVYTYSSLTGKMTPTGNPLGVVPDGTTTYRFVAYSFYGDPTTTPEESKIDPAKDLVWGVDEKTVDNTEAGRTVNITMKHKFARVRVRIDASAIAEEITDFSDVTIEGKKEANLDIKTGNISAGDDLAAIDVTSSLTAVDEVTLESGYHGYQAFYPSPVAKVTIGSIELTIDGTTGRTFSGSTLFSNFNTLQAGRNYTFVVELRENRWAYSNIYWDSSLNSDTGGLTFDKKKTNPSHADWQGIFFKWGSLVGISPVGDHTSASLFIPNNITLKTWDDSKTLSSNDTPWGSAGFENIPFIVPVGSLDHHVYDDADFINYRGDICSYLTDGAWRLPNLMEMFSVEELVSFTSGPGMTNDVFGQSPIGANVGVTLSSCGSAFLPASGYRNRYGQLFVVSGEGLYPVGNHWEGSYYYLHFYNSGGKATGSLYSYSYAGPVRCIKN
jgi:hypothetical protein